MSLSSLLHHHHQQPQRHPSVASPPVIRNGVVTHPYLHVRDAHDAHIVLEAVRLNILPIVRRRLLTSERDELRSGHVYVWEEAQDDGGLLRWTDGRRWSQSRMRGDYLFYEEKVETTQEERDAKAARRALRAADPTAVLPLPTRRKDRPSKPDGLTKQTYSVTVHLPGSSEPRKWHLVAYFSGNDYNRLPVVENYEYLKDIQVQHSIFVNHKLYSPRMDRNSPLSDESDVVEDQQGTGTSRSLPVPSRHYNHHSMSTTPYPPQSTFVHQSPTGVHNLLNAGQNKRHSFSALSSRDQLDPSLRLPPISPQSATSTAPILPYPQHGGLTRSPEDRRVLDSFRVIL